MPVWVLSLEVQLPGKIPTSERTSIMKFRLPQFSQVNWHDWKTYFVLPFVLVAYAFWKSLEALRTQVWNKSSWSGGVLHELLAIAVGWESAVQATSTLNSTLLGLCSGFLTWAYVTPIVWLCALRPAYHFVKWCWDHLDWVDTNIVGPLLKLPARAFSWLPGAAAGWANMKDTNWFVALVRGISYLTGAVFALRLGWLTKEWLVNGVPVGSFFGFLTHQFIVGGSWAAGLLVAGAVGRLLLGAMDKGEKEGVGAIVSAAATYASWGLLTKLATFLGVWSWAPGAVTYILLATYGFPFFYLLFASGFWKKVWKKIEPSLEHFYQGKATNFRHIALQSLGIGIALSIVGASCLLWWTLGVGLLVAVPAALATLLVAYAFTQEAIDQDYGNALVGIVSAVALAVGAGYEYAHLGFVFGVWGGIVVGILTALLSAISIPLLYCGIEWLANLPYVHVVTDWLGWALPALHKSYIDSVAEPTFRACERVYNYGYGYDRRSDEKDAKKLEKAQAFRRMALHGINGLVAWGLASAAVFGVQKIAFAQTFEPWAGWVAAAIVAIASVGLVGRAIYYAGLELCGGLAAVYVGLKVGAFVLPAQTLGYWFAGPFGVAVAAATYVVGFPVVVIVARALTSWAAPWLNVPLDWLNDRAWKLLRGFVRAFEHLFEFIYDLVEPLWKWVGRMWVKYVHPLWQWLGRMWLAFVAFTAPLWMTIAGAVASAVATCREVWKSLFG